MYTLAGLIKQAGNQQPVFLVGGDESLRDSRFGQTARGVIDREPSEGQCFTAALI